MTTSRHSSGTDGKWGNVKGHLKRLTNDENRKMDVQRKGAHGTENELTCHQTTVWYVVQLRATSFAVTLGGEMLAVRQLSLPGLLLLDFFGVAGFHFLPWDFYR